MANDYVSYKDSLPRIGERVEIVTKYGVRTGSWHGQAWGWRLDDTTHPLQNVFLGFDDAPMWRKMSRR